MADIADLGIKVTTTGADAGTAQLKGLEKQAKASESAIVHLVDAVGRLVAAYATWRTGEAVIGKFIHDTAEAERVQAQLTSALRSTGAVAGQTIEALNKHADALRKLSAYDDEAINSAQALLLTFTRIRGDTFPKATQAVLDLATAMHTDLNSAAVQVGKALNDPILGMTALARSGIQFSVAQKQMVKQLVESNNLIGAQKIILKELENQFGGSARAARGTLGGALQALKSAWDDLFEATGPGADHLRDAVEGLVDKISDPSFITAVHNFGTALFDSLAAVVPYIDKFMQLLTLIHDQAQGKKPLNIPSYGPSGTGTQMNQHLKDMLDPGSTDVLGIKFYNGRAAPETSLTGGEYPFGDMGSFFNNATRNNVAHMNDKPKVPTLPWSPTADQIAAMDKAAKAYDKIKLSAQQYIEQQNLALQVYGMSAEAAARLTHEQELLGKAAAANLNLTPQQRKELIALADAEAVAEVHTKQLTSLMDALADVLGGLFAKPIKDAQEFFDTVLSGFGSLGQANLNTGLKSLLSGQAFAANDNSSSWTSATAKVFGDAVKAGAKDGTKGGFGDLLKSIPGGAGTVNAGLGGLGLGYQTQNPLMGALGGAVSGLSAGPIGAVVGGVAGLIGGLIGMNEALEKAKKTLSDNRGAIDQFIAAGLGKTIDADTLALAQFKAQGAQLVEVAKAAGDKKLVAQLNAAMAGYKNVLAAQHVQADIDKNRNDLINSYRDQASALQSVIDQTRDFITSMDRFRDSLKLDRQFSPLNPQGLLEESQKQFNLLLNKAKLGDANAQGQLQGAATSYLGAAQGYLGSSDRYTAIFNQVEDALGQVTDTAQTRISGTEAQLEATNKSLTLLGDLNSTALDQVAELSKIAQLQVATNQVTSDQLSGLQDQIADLAKALKLAPLKKAS